MYCVIKLILAIAYFKAARPDLDFWSWLFSVSASYGGRFFGDRCFIKFLLYDALQRKDDAGVCEVCEKFLVHQWPEIPQKSLARIKHSAEVRHDQWLLRQLAVRVDGSAPVE